MDILIRTLAVLTLLWGGWIYLKSSDAGTELRRIRNELKLAKQELVNTQATYKAEDKKRETLAGEVDALKEASQELRKAITAKKEEKRQRAAQERRERLEEERKAQEEEREARIKEEKERRESEMALLEREKQLEREEEERKKAEQAEMDAKQAETEAKRAAESAKRMKAFSIQQARNKVLDLQDRIALLLQAQERYVSFSPPSSNGSIENDYGRMEKIGKNWTLYLQQGAEAVRDGDQKRFEMIGKKLQGVAKSINALLPGEASYISVATSFVNDGRRIFKLRTQLEKLRKETTKKKGDN